MERRGMEQVRDTRPSRYATSEVEDNQYFDPQQDDYNDFEGPEQYRSDYSDVEDYWTDEEHNNNQYWSNETNQNVHYRHPDSYMDQPFRFCTRDITDRRHGRWQETGRRDGNKQRGHHAEL